MGMTPENTRVGGVYPNTIAVSIGIVRFPRISPRRFQGYWAPRPFARRSRPAARHRAFPP